MAVCNKNPQEPFQIHQETWNSLPNLPLLTGSTIPNVGRRFFIHSPSTIFKFGSDEGEADLTSLARSVLGSCVPSVVSIVNVLNGASKSNNVSQGIVLTYQSGTPIIELWPSLTASQRETVKNKLCHLLLQLRSHQFAYYGRPRRQPYVISSGIRKTEYPHCTSRSEWNESRIHALHSSSSKSEHVFALEQLQRNVAGTRGWDRPVLTHGDLSDRNILIDPHTLEVTGFLDWERANIMPAYFEYVAARLIAGHDTEWRKEILDVLRSVLRYECNALLKEGQNSAEFGEGEERYRKTLSAWDAVTDIERMAHEYDDDCSWTFETGLPACANH